MKDYFTTKFLIYLFEFMKIANINLDKQLLYKTLITFLIIIFITCSCFKLILLIHLSSTKIYIYMIEFPTGFIPEDNYIYSKYLNLNRNKNEEIY